MIFFCEFYLFHLLLRRPPVRFNNKCTVMFIIQANAIAITDGGGGERSDSASGGRRSGKRPEVQHYKPGAFSGSRKPEDCEGNPGNSNNSTATEKTSLTGGKGGQPSEDKPQQVWPLTQF